MPMFQARIVRQEVAITEVEGDRIVALIEQGLEHLRRRRKS